MTDKFKIHGASIDYRKGCIEIAPNIHPGLINVETFDLLPEADVERFNDSAVQGNTELELTPNQARDLAEALRHAADVAEQSS